MSSTVRTVDMARDLGVVIDSGLSMADQVSTICCAAYYHLRQLRIVTRCLTPEATKTTVQAFIYCCLNYCNALMPYCTVLQTTYCDDFSPSRMRQLTWWLDPTGQTISHQSCDGSTGCIEFKLALLIHKSLNGSTPRYLSDECQLVSDVGRHGFIQLHCISPT